MATSSSAIAERPRDASYLSVLSFNSTVLQPVFYYCYFGFRFSLPLRTIKCCSVVYGVTLRLFVIIIIRQLIRRRNMSIKSLQGRHKHFVCLPWNTTPLYQRLVSSSCNGPSQLCFTLGDRTVHSTRWSLILAENRDLSTQPAFDAPVRGVPVGILPYLWYGKKLVMWLPDGVWGRLFVLTEYTNVTDRQTPHGGIGRAYA